MKEFGVDSYIFYKKIVDKYPKRKIMIEISEDLENGSYKEYNL